MSSDQAPSCTLNVRPNGVQSCFIEKKEELPFQQASRLFYSLRRVGRQCSQRLYEEGILENTVKARQQGKINLT